MRRAQQQAATIATHAEHVCCEYTLLAHLAVVCELWHRHRCHVIARKGHDNLPLIADVQVIPSSITSDQRLG